ncbi:MAG: hypothetical protein DMG53_14965 [Acidobacteria bacterium]|nr:MAG: hypothetical protein DMG53_14965 [Acidobacteriota bacterium]
MPFADQCFFVLRLDTRVERLFGNFTPLRLFSPAFWFKGFLVPSLAFWNALFCSTVLAKIP